MCGGFVPSAGPVRLSHVSAPIWHSESSVLKSWSREKGFRGFKETVSFEATVANAQQRRMASNRGGEVQLPPWLYALCLASMLSAGASVKGAPILGPDLANCRPVIPPRRTASDSVECCLLDTGRPILDFKYNPDLPMRVRRPIHKLDDDFIRKYERAYALMRALPPHDPRSWSAQSKLHCSYCAAAYTQFNSSETLDVHHGWLLIPFHRWFVYFHERILASLIGDDSFAIPYWAWDVQNETSPAANIMPSIFTNPRSPLFDRLRCHIHRPPHRVDLNIQVHPHNKEPEELQRNNYYNMWRVMVGETKTPEAFFGGKFAQGTKVKGRAGRFELGPHAAVHGWTGDENTVFGEDMAPAYTAARDPLFFAHHSQVDRLWLMWKRLGGRDLDDPDWLDAEFLFYDENADIVRVNVRGCLDIEKLRVSYEEVPADWLEHTPLSIWEMGDPKFARVRFFQKLWKNVRDAGVAKMAKLFESSFSRREDVVVLGGGRAVVTSRVARPEASVRRTMMRTRRSNASSLSSVEFDEVLVLSGVVTKPFDIKVLFNIFVELPEADENTRLDCAESLGGVYLEPEGRSGEETVITREFSHKVGMGDRFRILGISRKTALTVTFVPAWDPQHDADVTVEFTELKLDLQIAR